MLTPHQQLAWISSLLMNEMAGELYGTITIKMEKGSIKQSKIERTELPPVDEGDNN